jgi:hypothetical protein
VKTPIEGIKKMLKKAEEAHELPDGILWKVYLEEARVVHKGNRRDVYKNLRGYLSELVKESTNED